MRAYFFYPLLALVAAGLILASFGPSLQPPVPGAHAGKATAAGLVYGPSALAGIDPGSDQLLYVDRSLRGDAKSVQLGTFREAGDPDPARLGAALRLTPADGEALRGAPLTVTIAYRPIASNLAPRLSVSAQGTGPANWVTRDIPVAEGSLRFDLPASDAPLSAIGLWPHPQAGAFYSNYGIEILSVRVQRAAPAG